MPLLFAVTLFVSASLLFMVQPMVGKLVLPLLGGSPAVWNACMVFFQALLLLGYLYADRLTRHPDTRKQWYIHMGVMSLPVVAFVLAVMLGSRGTPIAVAESLAPTDGSAIVSVLAILTVAIGIPFFVCSTSATLLQKWFTYTGHPSARDPYFLYAASNFGSLISLLGYPIFIEPNMTQSAQTWFWAVGFILLFALIAFCGHAAVNPLGVPPSTQKQQGKQQAAADKTPAAPSEPPPSWLRMAKWTILAFVPSSLMLGVTFHMTTDIASIPLLWVGPLALYLVTFIIAFGKTPPWFRILIGNLAPVMILLLVFLMLSDVRPGTGLELLLYNLTFFAAAMMCHYELARDRPSPQYLTTYFLIMSFGGVLGGIFNSLLAPVIFTQSYEFPLALIIACFMVPKINPLENVEKESKMSHDTALAADVVAGASTAGYAYAFRWLFRWVDRDKRLATVLDFVIPVVIGVLFWQLQKMPQKFEWYTDMLRSIARAMPFGMSWNTVYVIVTFAVPVMVCFFFVDRPVRFGLCVAAILLPNKLREGADNVVHTERSFFGILKIEETVATQYLRDQTKGEDPPPVMIDKTLEDGTVVKRPVVLGYYEYRRLVHGTTLHGTQVAKHERHILDDFQFLTAMNPWENLAVLGAIQNFDARQEPLTYYHRTGPVGAMFGELTRRGKDKQHVAMVGLGTGSVACYAQKGQKLTFYEIDPAVRRLVEEPWKVMNEKELQKYGSAPITDPKVRALVEKIKDVKIHDQASYDEKVKSEPYDKRPVAPDVGPFTYVSDARKRGAEVIFHMGDARLKLKDTPDKYALLLVDAFSSDSIPVHLLTVEAVRLYLQRITDDGILALHISNKYVKLEPVVAAIAAIATEEGLVARVWNDDAENKHGKTASSWVALARKPEHLGERLCHPIGDLMVRPVWPDSQLIDVIKYKYPELSRILESSTGKQQETILAWLDKRTGDPQAALFAALIRKYKSEYETMMDLLRRETGYGFRPLVRLDQVDAWTDDYADVMRVMTISQLQAVRKLFGLPTPVER